jgi:hypothetical protein
MRSKTILAAFAAMAFAASAAAQSVSDVYAYNGLLLTPVAGLQSMPLLGGNADKQSQFGVRYGATDNTGPTVHRAAATFAMPAGPGQVGFTAGAGWCDGCKSSIVVGVDWLAALNSNDFRVGIRPAIGMGIGTEAGSGSYYAAAVSLPFSWIAPNTGVVRFVPFLEPGVGYAGFNGNGINEHSARAMLGGGIAATSDERGYTIALSAKKIFLEGGRMSYALGCSFPVSK